MRTYSPVACDGLLHIIVVRRLSRLSITKTLPPDRPACLLVATFHCSCTFTAPAVDHVLSSCPFVSPIGSVVVVVDVKSVIFMLLAAVMTTEDAPNVTTSYFEV